MKALERVRGQEQARRLIESALAAGRLSHAHIFAGPEGVGRLTAALGLAAAIVCREAPPDEYCGECRHCARVMSFDHPDVRLTVPMLSGTTPEEMGELLRARAADGMTPLSVSSRGYIGIGQVREIEQRLSRRAYEGRGHVEIIAGADTLRAEASNALLKTLEEPPDQTYLILLTSCFSGLLPTIRSRAQVVRFRRLPTQMIAGQLVERLGLDPETALGTAASASGSLGRALLAARAAEQGAGSTAGEVLQALFTSSLMGIMEMCAATSRTLGGAGMLELVRELRSLVHDMNRMHEGRPCLHHMTEDLPDPGAAGRVERRELAGTLEKCERRIARNVNPSMALAAALLRARRADAADRGATAG